MKARHAVPLSSRLHRFFVRLLGSCLGVLVTSPGLSPAQEPRDDPGTRGRRPNILLIVSDDHGSTDLGCFGAPDLRTPNLDRLAGQGLMLRQFNVAAPLCTPSRGAFLTGRCPLATGVKANDNAMPRDEFTLAEALQGVGYRTALVGKWHLGSQPGEPLHHGFDEFFGFLKGTIENYEHDRFDWSAALASPYEKRMDYFVAHDLWRNGNAVTEDGFHFGELVVREVSRLLAESKESGNPFFIYAAFNSPHYPVQPLSRFYRAFEGLEEPRRSHAAFLATLDDQIGRILARVDELELAEDTLVIFFGDHGYSVEERTRLWNPDAAAPAGGGSSSPFRGTKGQLWEGGIRVPAIIRWPRALPAGEVREQWITSLDLMPTIAGLVGAELPRRVDGIDVFPAWVSGRAELPRRLLHFSQGANWAVREGEWKLVFQGGQRLLANLAEDPGESRDFSAEMPAVTERLARAHLACLAQPDADHDGLDPGECALSDLEWTLDAGEVRGDYTPDGGCLEAPDGSFVAKGIGMTGDASARWDLGGLRDRLRCRVFIAPDAPEGAAAAFEVLGDAKRLHRTSVMTRESGTLDLDIDVTGVKELVLGTPAASGNPVTIWAHARVSSSGETLRKTLVDPGGRWKLRPGNFDPIGKVAKAEIVELHEPAPGIEYYLSFTRDLVSWRDCQLLWDEGHWLLTPGDTLVLEEQQQLAPGRWRLVIDLPGGRSGFLRLKVRAIGN